jgi:hypothetical protein
LGDEQFQSKATLMPAIPTPKAVRPGVNYQHFDQTDADSDKAKQWPKLPDFENLKPKLQGIARGPAISSLAENGAGFCNPI